MRKTYQEIVTANPFEQREWARTETDPRQLQEFIHKGSFATNSKEYEYARTAIEILVAESAERSSQRLERQTLVLVCFTKYLVGLTCALIFIGVVQIVMIIFKR